MTTTEVERVVDYIIKGFRDHQRLEAMLAGEIGMGAFHVGQEPSWFEFAPGAERPPRLPSRCSEPFGGGLLTVDEVDQLITYALFTAMPGGRTNVEIDAIGDWAQRARTRFCTGLLVLERKLTVRGLRDGREPEFGRVE
jgi:hypothetical protein